MLSTDSRKFEDEVSAGLDLDDSEILVGRVNAHKDYVNLMQGRNQKVYAHSRTQWTRVHDGVQEHFSSHVLINGAAYKLPSNIYALKQIAKQSWMLYKKRECERRKRLRVKLEKEREIEAKGGPANILLSMVDTCEVCKKLYVTVNLFWGITICDICYFNEDVIKDIMNQRKDYVNNENNNPFRIVEKVLAKPNTNDRFFMIEKETPPKPILKNVSFREQSPEVVVANDLDDLDSFLEINIEPPPPPPEQDFRPVSSYDNPPVNSEDETTDEEIEKIKEEREEENVLLYDGYFSQTNFYNTEGEGFLSD